MNELLKYQTSRCEQCGQCDNYLTDGIMIILSDDESIVFKTKNHQLYCHNCIEKESVIELFKPMVKK